MCRRNAGGRGKKSEIKEVLKVKQEPKWYDRLVEDCKEIIREENLDIIRRKHQLGSRILKEKENIPYGQIFTFIKELAKDLDHSWQDLYFCTKFADKYSDIEGFIHKFSNELEKFTWYAITQSLLYEKFEVESPPDLVTCDICGRQVEKPEMPSTRICAFCLANLLADRETGKIGWLK